MQIMKKGTDQLLFDPDDDDIILTEEQRSPVSVAFCRIFELCPQY